MADILSDLTDVLRQARRKPVVLTGDFNMGTQGRDKTARKHARVVFDRLEAWGLVDCIAHTRDSRPKVTNCDCSEEECAHVQTFRSKNKAGGFPTQLDYALMSGSISISGSFDNIITDEFGSQSGLVSSTF
jgi:endonuclease/exonuclease/phosphatase family metal-dependent hydrolase